MDPVDVLWVRLGKLATAGQLYDGNTPTVAQIAELVGVSHATIYRHLGPAR